MLKILFSKYSRDVTKQPSFLLFTKLFIATFAFVSRDNNKLLEVPLEAWSWASSSNFNQSSQFDKVDRKKQKKRSALRLKVVIGVERLVWICEIRLPSETANYTVLTRAL